MATFKERALARIDEQRARIHDALDERATSGFPDHERAYWTARLEQADRTRDAIAALPEDGDASWRSDPPTRAELLIAGGSRPPDREAWLMIARKEEHAAPDFECWFEGDNAPAPADDERFSGADYLSWRLYDGHGDPIPWPVTKEPDRDG